MTADTQTHIHRHIDTILDTQTVVTSDTQRDITSYLIIKMKSDTHTGMKLETYDYQICYSTICVLIPDLKHCL